jgi:DegV family protein with EDD domain
MRALSAGIQHLFQRREYLNRINVFPVPDGDTGTNMAFTFKTVLDATLASPDERVDELMAHIADAALDGARGNSGAIMAQYFQGFKESVEGCSLLTAEGFAKASLAGAQAAWTAMSEPVEGTLPTVLQAFSDELIERVAGGEKDIQALFRHGKERAQVALDNTPNQLAVLRQAGVVDAGGQGFVDLLDGIWAFIEKGEVDAPVPEMMEDTAAPAEEFDVGEHRFCTECVIEGAALDRDSVMARLNEMDSSSLVVAGSQQRIRVHLHVNNPAEVFLACEEFGAITQQKADDMERQHGLLNHAGRVAVVVDSGADIPPAEADRLNIHIVPVRLSFGDREYLDGVTLSPQDFYALLQESDEAPLTSQPPAQDFSRQYSLLTSHGYGVLSVGLSEQLSGTTTAARQAAEKVGGGRVRIFDTLNASAGQGLLAIVAAEAAAMGMSIDEIESLLMDLRPRTLIYGVADDLSFAVKGGRVPAWIKRLTDLLRINPVLTANAEGRVTVGGVHKGRGVSPKSLARRSVKKMDPEKMYRVLIAHVNNPQGAREVRRAVLQGHGRIHSCHITDAGPALGVHLGIGGLIVGMLPQPSSLN